MTIEIENYISAALEGIKDQIEEAHNLAIKIWEADLIRYSQDDMDKLEKLLRTASDSVEILQNYNGEYDRIDRWCFGERPGRYEVQCRLCQVQRLCCEETANRRSRFSTLRSVWTSTLKLLRRKADRPKDGLTLSRIDHKELSDEKRKA